MLEADIDSLSDTYLSFNVDKKCYSIEIAYVTEVIEMQEVIEMPDMPMYVKGVINLRGNVISIIDLKQRLGALSMNDDEQQCIIISRIGDKNYGLMVDNVNDVIEIDKSVIDDSSELFINGDSIARGTAKLSDELCILLNVDKIIQ